MPGDDRCPRWIVYDGHPFQRAGHKPSEEQQHNVAIGKAFAVSKLELTFAEWDACASHGDCDPHVSDGGFGRSTQPVINVTWDDAQRYVAWLSALTGRPYRLMSEAEYEYAARAGTTTAYPWGDQVGKNNTVCVGCGSKWDGKQPAPAGSFVANPFGLYDMIGNVWEWVEDCVHDAYSGAPQDGSAWTAGGNCRKPCRPWRHLERRSGIRPLGQPPVYHIAQRLF